MSASDNTQVLEFNLGESNYCVDIEYVAEIVDGGEMTSVPNSDDHVEGVMDLRGRTTTIVNPCAVLEDDVDPRELVTDGGRTQHRIVVLDPETVDSDGAVGWLVSDVHEVRRVDEETLEADAVADTDVVRGLIRDDDGFTVWVDPPELAA